MENPPNDIWIENELSVSDRERKWFRFEREHTVPFYHLMYEGSWNDITKLFNEEYNCDISIDQAKKMSRRRMRYVMGYTHVKLSGNNDKNEWKKKAREFEKYHRDTEERMNEWSNQHKGNFPTFRTTKDIPFNAGSYYDQCLERIPQYFTDMSLRYIRSGSVLRLISYDPKHGYVKVDFPKDIREMIKPGSPDNDYPWDPNDASYVIIMLKEDWSSVEMIRNPETELKH